MTYRKVRGETAETQVTQADETNKWLKKKKSLTIDNNPF